MSTKRSAFHVFVTAAKQVSLQFGLAFTIFIFLPLVTFADDARSPANPSPENSTPSETPQSKTDSQEAPDNEPGNQRFSFQFAVYAGYNSGHQLNFSNATVTSQAIDTTKSTSTGSVAYNFSPAAALGLEVVLWRENSLGIRAGLDFEFPRNIDSTTVAVNGNASAAAVTSLTPPSSGSTLTVGYSSIDALYRWSSLYLPLGLSLTLPTSSNPPQALSALGTSFGAEVGLGYLYKNHLALEVLLKAGLVQANAATTGSLSTPTHLPITTDLGTGSLYSAQFNIKWMFSL